MDNNKGNSNWKLILGLATGAAAGWWLNSTKGRQWRKNTSEALSETGTQLNEQARIQLEKAQSSLETTIDKSREYIDELSQNVKGKIDEFRHTAKDKVDDAETSFEKGAQKAKAKLNKKATQANNALKN
ncbi:MAG: hypothetical protein DHS20C18_12270 [Saprospiraceae bacterium]|nr:MAG: hypothetical protein DHS20C18_12270 [Saprospiraceae bacterium]